MKHQQGLLLALATFFLGRSRKLRWLVPVLPLVVAVYRKAMAHPAPHGRLRPIRSAGSRREHLHGSELGDVVT